MTTLASLRAALRAGRAIADRRAGRDPSTQEAATPVRAWLTEAEEEMGTLEVRLHLRRVAALPDEEAAALAQDFEDRLALADLAGLLRTAHQKLLSLYPAVPEALLEEARRYPLEADRLLALDGPKHAAGLVAFLDDLAGFRARLRAALRAR